MQHIELDQVQTHLSQMLQNALAGEEVVITQADQPVLKLVRIATAAPRRKRGSAKGQIRIDPDFDAPLDDFERRTRDRVGAGAAAPNGAGRDGGR